MCAPAEATKVANVNSVFSLSHRVTFLLHGVLTHNVNTEEMIIKYLFNKILSKKFFDAMEELI